MDGKCDVASCQNTLTQEPVLVCQGLCHRKLHGPCIGAPRNVLVSSITTFLVQHFVCTECTNSVEILKKSEESYMEKFTFLETSIKSIISSNQRVRNDFEDLKTNICERLDILTKDIESLGTTNGSHKRQDSTNKEFYELKDDLELKFDEMATKVGDMFAKYYILNKKNESKKAVSKAVSKDVVLSPQEIDLSFYDAEAAGADPVHHQTLYEEMNKDLEDRQHNLSFNSVNSAIDDALNSSPKTSTKEREKIRDKATVEEKEAATSTSPSKKGKKKKKKSKKKAVDEKVAPSAKKADVAAKKSRTKDDKNYELKDLGDHFRLVEKNSSDDSEIFYVRNVTTEANEATIINYVNRHFNIMDIRCREVVPYNMRRSDLKFKNFKLNVPRKDAQKIADNRNWPNGVSIRRWSTETRGMSGRGNSINNNDNNFNNFDRARSTNGLEAGYNNRGFSMDLEPGRFPNNWNNNHKFSMDLSPGLFPNNWNDNQNFRNQRRCF